MTKRRAAVIAQVVIYGAIVTVVGFLVAALVSHEHRIDMLATTMAASLTKQGRLLEDVAEDRQMMMKLMRQVCRIEGPEKKAE